MEVIVIVMAMTKEQYDLLKNGTGKCWLADNCPCRTAVCFVDPLPDEGCFLYRWFRDLIYFEELGDTDDGKEKR